MELQYIEMGMRIKLRRKELKIKQTDFAETLGISNNHLSSIENGNLNFLTFSHSNSRFLLIHNHLLPNPTPDTVL